MDVLTWWLWFWCPWLSPILADPREDNALRRYVNVQVGRIDNIEKWMQHHGL